MTDAEVEQETQWAQKLIEENESRRQPMTQKAPERIWAAYTDQVYEGKRGITISDEAAPGHIEFIPNDHALALVASAYEDAAQHHDYHVAQYTRIGSKPDAAAHAEHAKQIRARTDDDAQAALERVERDARNEALREAADKVVPYDDETMSCRNVILALITEDQSDE